MEATLPGSGSDELDRRVAEAVRREGARLRNFIRRRVGDDEDAEDLLQEVFGELVETCRLLKPVEEVSAWLFRVARNRIVDRFRRKRHEPASTAVPMPDEDDDIGWEDLLPSSDAGPDEAYARTILLEELDRALDELPPEQREVFVAHELEGRSFRDLAAQTGVSVNTLLSRKHYARLYLRQRLQAIYDEFASR